MPTAARPGARALVAMFALVFATANLVVGVASAGTDPTDPPLVLKPKAFDAARAATLLHGLFPDLRMREDDRTDSVVVFGSKTRLDAVRTTFEALDSKSPRASGAQTFALHFADPGRVASTLRKLYPSARIVQGPQRTVVALASPPQLAEIATIVQAVDVAPPTPSAAPRTAGSVNLSAAHADDVAKIVSGIVPGVSARATQQTVVFSGAPDAVDRAKQLAGQLDLPEPSVRYTQVYRLRFVDAASVAQLVQRTFPDVKVEVDTDLNAFTVFATTAEHERIADAIAQLDIGVGAPGGHGSLPVSQPGQNTGAAVAANGQTVEVVNLRAAVPGSGTAVSSSAADIATAVNQSLQGVANDVHVTVPPNNPTQLIVAGNPESVRLAKQLIVQLDVAQRLVVLDTEIVEVDESVANNLGLQLGQTAGLNSFFTTTYTETTPAPNPITGVTPPLQGLQPLARSPVTFTVQLNTLISRGNARVLADPRITTISGRTASIRAGDNISILTTTGGGTGAVATTQIQTFQTGVTLDITPVLNAGNFITVSLHPVVNSLSGTTNGIPQISTRDTQTTVAMQADQTLVIGGLIEDSQTRNVTKIPLLGDLPLVGSFFRNKSVTGQRNELVITVTPHILNPGETSTNAPRATIPLPKPQALPTLPSFSYLPPARPQGLRGLFRPHGGAAAAQPAPAATVVVPLGLWPTPTPAPSTTAPIPRATTTPTPMPTPAAGPTPFQLKTFGAPTAAPTPATTPTAFVQANTFTYGSAPQNNYAGPGDPVQIYYATFSPTVLKNNTQTTVFAITSSNVAKVVVGYEGFTIQLSPAGSPGQWQSLYNFTTTGLPIGQNQIPLTLTASRLDGTSSTITIPISVTQ